MPKLSLKYKVAILILSFLLPLFTINYSPLTREAHALAPKPLPCFNPIPTDNLTDNYITDLEGDPPGPEGANNIEALKFTFVHSGPIGSKPGEAGTAELKKTMTFNADFSKLQAIFASQNSNWLGSTSLSEDHAQADLMNLDRVDLNRYQGPLQKTTPKAITDALKEKYVGYINQKPELAGSELKITDINGQNEKNINELVQQFGMPNPPKAGENKQSWLDTWGKYWEKIPSTYNEFYLGKLEFRPVHGTSAIEAMKRGDDGSCFPNTAVRTVEFPVPNFFRTSAISGQLNQVLVPRAAQSPGNILIDIKSNILGAKTSLQNFIENCFKAATNNPVTNALKNVISKAIEKLDSAQAVYAAGCSYSGPNPANPGDRISVTHNGFAAGETIRIADRLSGTQIKNLGTTSDSLSGNRTQNFTIPSSTIPGGYSVLITTRFPIRNFNCGDIDIEAAPVPTPTPAATPVATSCSYSGPNPANPGASISVTHRGFAAGETIRIADRLSGTQVQNLGTTSNSLSSSQTEPNLIIPAATIPGGYSVLVTTRFPIINVNCGNIDITSTPVTPSCSFVSLATPPVPGTQINITHQGFAVGETIRIVDRLAGVNIFDLDTTRVDSTGGAKTQTVTILPITIPGGYEVQILTRFPSIIFDCGDIDIEAPPPAWTLSVQDPATRAVNPPSNSINFTVSPAVTSADTLYLIIYRLDETTNVQIDCNPATPLFDSCYDSNRLQPGSTFTWTPLLNGKFRAILLNIWFGEASNEVIFNVGYILQNPVDVNGRTVTFRWTPAADGNIGLLVRRRDDPTITVFQSSSLFGGGPIPAGIYDLQWFKAPPGQYEVALLNLFLAPVTPWIPFDVTFDYTWTVFPLEEDSCIKVHTNQGKAGNAPYCAIYPNKFEFPGQENITSRDTCQNKTETAKLNPETSVVCTFTFDWSSKTYDNDPAKSLEIPASGNGHWDTCDPPQGNIRTCYLTVGVWPDFRIPFLCQTWNNTMYSGDKEYCPQLQQTGRPGVYSFFRPKATDYDPFAALVESCNPDIDPDSQACKALINKLTSGDYPNQYPGIKDCVEQNIFGGPGLGTKPGNLNYNLIKCVHGIAKLITKKLPGEVNTLVQGANSGQVLAGNDGNQKERFIGAVDCEKHFARDIALKPKALQEHLGVKLECDLTASPQPAATPIPNASPGTQPTPDTRTGSGCDGGSAFASLLPNPIPQSVGAQSPSLLNRIGSNLLDAARYGSAKSGVPCELLIGLHYVEGSWQGNASFISGRIIGQVEPDVPSASACTAYNGNWTGGGCTFSSLFDTAYYAGDHIKDKMAALGFGWRPPTNFNEMVGAMSYYNGGGNSNCGEGVPYNSPCPPPTGIDDPYAVSHFDNQHATMYLIFCADLTRCDSPQVFSRDGAATAAKEFYLRP